MSGKMNVGVGITVSILSTFLMIFINNRGLVDGPYPAKENFVVSIAFLLLWTILGFIMGRLKKPVFLVFTGVFWIVGLVNSTICVLVTTTPLWVISFLFLAPLNGLKYLSIFRGIHGLPLFAIETLLPIVVTLIGYLFGLSLCFQKVKMKTLTIRT